MRLGDWQASCRKLHVAFDNTIVLVSLAPVLVSLRFILVPYSRLARNQICLHTVHRNHGLWLFCVAPGQRDANTAIPDCSSLDLDLCLLRCYFCAATVLVFVSIFLFDKHVGTILMLLLKCKRTINESS